LDPPSSGSSASRAGAGSRTAHQITRQAATIGNFRTKNIQMNVAASTGVL